MTILGVRTALAFSYFLASWRLDFLLQRQQRRKFISIGSSTGAIRHIIVKSADTAEETAEMRVRRWHYESLPLHLRQFSGYKRTSRQSENAIRRFVPSHPPANSAEKLHNLHFVQ